MRWKYSLGICKLEIAVGGEDMLEPVNIPLL